MAKTIDLNNAVRRGDPRVEEVTKDPDPAPPRRQASVTTSIRIPEDEHTLLKMYCVQHRTSLQDLTMSLYREMIERKGRTQGSAEPDPHRDPGSPVRRGHQPAGVAGAASDPGGEGG